MRKRKNTLLSLMLCLMLAFGLTACGGAGKDQNPPAQSDAQTENPPAEQDKETPDPAPAEAESDTFIFTDSTGREVELPKNITKVASAGPLANVMIYAVKPEVIVGWSKKPSGATAKYIEQKYLDLPEYGGLYGSSADFNKEAVMQSAPDVIIDVGQWDEEYKAELDKFQEQIGIPVILVEENLDQTPAAYRTLGKLLGEEERGEALASYCEQAIKEAKEKTATIPEEERVRVYYAQGEDGLGTMVSGSIHSQIFELVGCVVVADTESVQVQQGGGTISMEQLMVWDPDVITFAKGSLYDTAADNPTWNALSAIKNGKYYEIPNEPYNWLGRPPGPNRMIGIRWLGNLIYPELYQYDIEKEVKDYFSLFYRYELTDEEVKALLEKSTLKGAGAQ